MSQGASFAEVIVAVILAIILIPFLIFGVGILLVILSYTWPIVLVILLIWVLVSCMTR